jgi:hypothetical protein
MENSSQQFEAVEMNNDMTDNEFKKKKKMFLKELKVTDDERREIERRTVGQLNNTDWIMYRRSRLTASNFGRVCKLKPTTSRAKLVKKILYYPLTKGNEHTWQV